MTFTREGLLLSAFLIIPGFIYYFVSRSVRTTYRETPSDVRVILDSFSATLVLVALEVSSLAVVTVFVKEVGNDLELILRDGLDAYVRKKPLTFFYAVVVVGVVNVIVMGLAGWFDWIESAIVWVLNRRKQAPWNVWYQMLRVGPEAGRKKPLKVRVRLKNGGLYHGALAAYPLTQSEGRDIALWEVSFSDSGNPRTLRPISTKHKTGLIVPAEQIKGIELIYPS